MRPIIWSNGGGTQSAAIAVLISQGKLPTPERSVMADTSRECAATWKYLENYIRPLLWTVGLEVEIVPHSYAASDIYDKGTMLLPAYTQNGNGKMRGFCSGNWKRDAVNKWLREPERGYGQKSPVIQWLGMSKDEIRRCKPAKQKWIDIQWPLIMWYGHCLDRQECVRLVMDAGLPKPPKSRCYMCPNQNNLEWSELRAESPEEFELAVNLEKQIIANDEHGGMFLHFSGLPLDRADLAVKDKPEHPLFGRGEDCESGLYWN